MTLHQSSEVPGIVSPFIGYLALVVTITTLVTGVLCKLMKELCRRIKKRRKSRRRKRVSSTRISTSLSRTESMKSETGKPVKPVLRSDSNASRVSITAVDFSIPKTRQNVLQQPLPEFAQARLGHTAGDLTTEEKRMSLVSMYFTDEQLALETIEPSEYKRLDHTTTIGKNCSLGEINFIVKYSDRTRKLNVLVVCGGDFPPRDFSGSLDTCLTVALLPDRSLRKQTAIHRRSVNPMYNENFIFHVTADEDVYSRSLLFVIFYFDQYSHSHVLGEEQVPLVDLHLGDETMVRCFLQEASSSSFITALQSMSHAEVGDILISLCYATKDQTLNVSIMKTSNLSASLTDSSEKVYVKAVFSNDNKRVSKRKTNLREVGSRYAIFNEALLFRVPRETLEQATLTISLNRYNVVGKSSTIGEVSFGPMSTGPEAAHWYDMLAKPENFSAMWHILRGFKFGEREVQQPSYPKKNSLKKS